MARIRTIKPDFWGSSKVARCSLPARLVAIGLLTEADDEGRLLASPKRIAGALFPNDDDVTETDVSRWLDEIEDAGFICRYEVDGVRYAVVSGFTEHQRVSHPSPSRLPPMPCPTTHEALANDSRNAPESFVPEREQGTGNKEEEQGSAFAHSQTTNEPFADEFDKWWSDYPRKIDKAKAFTQFKARRRDGVTLEELIAARDNYAKVAEPGFIKYPATFLAGKTGPWSEFVDGAPAGAKPAEPKPRFEGPQITLREDGKRFFPGTGWV